MLIFILVQTFRFRASGHSWQLLVTPGNMEENQVKEEEERQRTTTDSSGGGEWFDLDELSALLCELDAVATKVGMVF